MSYQSSEDTASLDESSKLESRAIELEHATIRIETGKGQPEAVRLYKSAGYHEIEAFGNYDGIHSFFFEKQLL